MQRLGGGDSPLVVVDYAHTPDALEKVLSALRPTVAEGGALVCVFGCGGDRDAGKRPEMGRVASTLADRVIVTSDNPRSEDPATIASAIVHGIRDSRQPPLAGRPRPRDGDQRGNRRREDRRRRADRGQGSRGLPGSEWRAHALFRTSRWRPRRSRAGAANDGHRDRRRALSPVACIGANVRFARVITDTRKLAPGDLFVALPGERFDGHDFVSAAFERGAAAALVAAERATGDARQPDRGDGPAAGAPRARRALARAVRRFRSSSSSAATARRRSRRCWRRSCARISARSTCSRPRAISTTRSGLPLTLLRAARPAHRVAVIELGMNHRGETALLAAVAQPTVAIVNNAQREHQEFMRTRRRSRGGACRR